MFNGVKVFAGIGIFTIFVIYIVFGPVLLVRNIREACFYATEHKNTVQVQATVTDIEESSASDGGSEYDIYLSYTNENIAYNDVYWRSVSFKDDYSLNETVSIEIFQAKPDEIAGQGVTFYFIGLLFPLFITIIGLLAVIKTFNPDFSLIKN